MVKEPQIEELKSKLRYGIKIWLEFKEDEKTKNILGSGWAKLLESIDKIEGGSLSHAAK